MASPQPAPQPWPPDSRSPGTPSAPRSDKSPSDALLAFRSEAKIEPATRPAGAGAGAGGRRPWTRPLSIGLGVLALGALGTVGLVSTEFVQAGRLPVPAPQTSTLAKPEGTLTVDSRPAGAQVTVDSIPRGVTPLKLTLPVGDHTLELQNGSATQSIPLAIQAGVVVSQYVDLPPAALPAAVGRLEITLDPPGARVTVDGLARGVTPVTLSNVVPGNHAVSIFGEDTTVTRAVTVSAGSTASVMASLIPAGASAGWVAFRVPFEMQLSEGGKLVGTTGTDRLMLPAGRHDLVLSNPAFEFEATLSVQVAAGKTATPTVTIPTGLLSINATPWADVMLDGKLVGTTPLANLSVPVGTHEVICRHPQLGERRQTVTVKARTPARIGISFR